MDSVRKLDKQLGCGQYGTVYQGYDEDKGRFVAIKEIIYMDQSDSHEGTVIQSSSDMEKPRAEKSRPPSSQQQQQQQQPQKRYSCHAAATAICREIDIMRRARHDNLVRYYGARRSTMGVQIIMEYVSGGSLEFLLERCGTVRESVCRSYVRDILHGLNYLHNVMHVCHRDVKPANVLLTADGRCKLSDFGIARTFAFDRQSGSESYMTTLTGTPWYMAPEVIGNDEDKESEGGHSANSVHSGTPKDEVDGYTSNADVWSLGVTVYEMISGTRPFGPHLRHATAIMFSILSSAANPPPLPASCAVSHELCDFLRCCLVHDRRLRPGAADLLAHPWINQSRTTRPAPPPAERRRGGEKGHTRLSHRMETSTGEEQEETDEVTRTGDARGEDATSRHTSRRDERCLESCTSATHRTHSRHIHHNSLSRTRDLHVSDDGSHVCQTQRGLPPSEATAPGVLCAQQLQRRLSRDAPHPTRDVGSDGGAPGRAVGSREGSGTSHMTEMMDTVDLMYMSRGHRDRTAQGLSPVYADAVKRSERAGGCEPQEGKP